jgi:hypothetical protein
LAIILLGLALTVIGPYLSVQGAMAIPTNADKTTSPPSTTNAGDGGTGDTPNSGDSNNGNGGNGGTADHSARRMEGMVVLVIFSTQDFHATAMEGMVAVLIPKSAN